MDESYVMLDRTFFPEDDADLLTIKQASEWASDYLKRNVTPSNISYLIQYGKVKRIGQRGNTLVSKQELAACLEPFSGSRITLVPATELGLRAAGLVAQPAMLLTANF